MSSMPSALATIPATDEATFNPAFAPLSEGTLRCPPARSWSSADLARSSTVTRVMVDIDDTIIEVHDYAKQGSGYGYSGVRGLNALLATVTTTHTAPVVVAQRQRKG